MKILHIIPAAFNYFDDIRKNAMALAETQKKLGFLVEAFTVQYNGLSSKQSAESSLETPLMNYSGLFREEDVLSQLSDYDIIHFHAPFFGVIGKICNKLKTKNHKYKIVVSYWRDPVITDIFSLYIFAYNRYYIPKISFFSDAQIFLPINNISFARISKWVKNKENIVNIDSAQISSDDIPLTPAVNGLKLDIENKGARACLIVYNKLINF